MSLADRRRRPFFRYGNLDGDDRRGRNQRIGIAPVLPSLGKDVVTLGPVRTSTISFPGGVTCFPEACLSCGSGWLHIKATLRHSFHSSLSPRPSSVILPLLLSTPIRFRANLASSSTLFQKP